MIPDSASRLVTTMRGKEGHVPRTTQLLFGRCEGVNHFPELYALAQQKSSDVLYWRVSRSRRARKSTNTRTMHF
jgi:hypothetical protein